MAGKGEKELVAGKTTAAAAANKEKDKKRPISQSARAGHQVLLHDWWLIKADSGSHGKRLGVGGFICIESLRIRSFSSAPVVKKHDAVTLDTVDGITVLLNGHLNRSRTLENGFSHQVCDDFRIGFPYYWEDFAALSASEEPAHFSASKGISHSDAYRTSDPGACGASSVEEESSQPREKMVSTPDGTEKKRRGSRNVEDVVLCSGPLTRSRTRVLDN